MTLQLDILTRVINVQWGTVVEQQGLIAEYPLADGSIGEPSATAESGEAFPGVAMGASGLGYTVLTSGLVCFGRPRDGKACFMAVPDYDIVRNVVDGATIKRGTLDENGHLTWELVGGGAGLVALTFAGEAFHAVYVEEAGVGSSRIETSFDGETWQSSSAFPAQDSVIYGGAVAYNRESYAAAGNVGVNPPEDADPSYVAPTNNLAWATSDGQETDGSMSWSFGRAEGMDDDPGANTGVDYCTNQSCTIAGGFIGGDKVDADGNKIPPKARFVAATFDKNVITLQTTDLESGEVTFRKDVVKTAAAAHSSSGSDWSNTTMPGVVVGYHTVTTEEEEHDASGGSTSTAVVYIRKSARDGYFLCSATSSTFETGEPSTLYSTVHKSSDGLSWSTIRSKPDSFFFTLSAIAKDLSKTTIVHI